MCEILKKIATKEELKDLLVKGSDLSFEHEFENGERRRAAALGRLRRKMVSENEIERDGARI